MLRRGGERMVLQGPENLGTSGAGAGGLPQVARARETIRELAALGQEAPAEQQSIVAALCARYAAALDEMVVETDRKLQARGRPDLLSQGLRRLEAALWQEGESLVPPSATDPRIVAKLQRLDQETTAARTALRELLRDELGLIMMPDQTGQPLDPRRHNVIASIPSHDPWRNSTVASQAAPGWMLGDVVLVPADVVRYAGTGSSLTAPAALADGEADRDEELWGRPRQA